MPNIKSPKKLIEVALPLEDINREASREKSIRHGHPSTLHLWWARRPLAAARAVIFAQMVNDPGGERGWSKGLTKEQAAAKREELFDIIRELVKWENTTNEEVLERARKAIRKSWRETCELNKGKPGFDPEKLPAFHDPFAGGGAIPLEAQRLGLESYASDLNPVAVMINKAMIEIPPRFVGIKPMGPVPTDEMQPDMFKEWPGATGLAEDVRRYGHWMREEAQKRIGNLYPQVEITAEMVKERPDLAGLKGKKLTVIAWLWARTVKSPHPDFSDVDVPLASTFVLAKKQGHDAYVQPVIEGKHYHFVVKVGKPPKEAENGTKLGGKGSDFICIMSNTPISGKYIKDESMSGRLGERMMAMVCESEHGRVYISPQKEHELIAKQAVPSWKPLGEMNRKSTDLVSGRGYGFFVWGDLFTPRQLVALNTFSDLVQGVRVKVISAAKAAGMTDDEIRLRDGGAGATAYGDALAVYLTMGVSRLSDACNSLCRWKNDKTQVVGMFGRQAIPMLWDFAENNVFNCAAGDYTTSLGSMIEVLNRFHSPLKGRVFQSDAQSQHVSTTKIISTDPPYYDNISYADLSDFFYVWMRRSLREIYPELFATLAVPKAEELIATVYRHGNKKAAELFFLNGMTAAMHKLAIQAHPAFPVTIYYAFKSSDTDEKGTGNTGWETFLQAVMNAGFEITGTWPMRTELGNRLVGNNANMLASSIVLVCRRRSENAEEVGRREFLSELRERMPEALRAMMGQDGVSSPIAPVDLAQAAIGPGMEIFSKYKAVLNADGTSMSVHEAMMEINRQITDCLNPDGVGFDAETLFCNDWFQQNGWGENAYGLADVLARAKGTSVERVRNAGVLLAEGGKVQLLNWQDYPEDYDPGKDKNRPTWEALHHLVRVLNRSGESAAGKLLSRMPEVAEDVRQLAYFLYTMCERKGDAEEARHYNELMTSWSAIVAASMDYSKSKPEQLELL
ncbi:MAG: DUF1156 domain-containing protein [Victivallales bacterium]|nr:DUF1156 domain-containing protein [Victivallales bacterium]